MNRLQPSPLLWDGRLRPIPPFRTLLNSSFSQYTPAGQDFDFCAEMKDNDPDTLLKEIEQYYEGYDPDYEAYLWIGTDGHGKNGAPYHIKDIVSDMEAAEAMINTLYETLKTALQ